MTNNLQRIEASTVRNPAGHYSHAMIHNGTIYVSGQLARYEGMSDEEAGDIKAQTARCLESVIAIIEAAGSDASRLVKVSIFISDIELWPVVNEVYAQVLGEHKPARIILPCPTLHFGSLVEIDAIAAA